jgi:hypothetical protein
LKAVTIPRIGGQPRQALSKYNSDKFAKILPKL